MLLKDNDIFRGRQVQVGNRYQGRHCGPSYVSGSVTMMQAKVICGMNRPPWTSLRERGASVLSVSRFRTSLFAVAVCLLDFNVLSFLWFAPWARSKE